MGDIAIRVEGISKKYRIGKMEKYQTLRDTVASTFSAPFRLVGKLWRGEVSDAAGLDETIWALKKVSFEVKRGEVIGVIGGNGAGKSTLLKILSRITEPTTGFVDIYGRVGSLLEVGTGFHPELTGRENIYLNGAVLGMKHAEIDRKFDEIVAFSEVEKFVDTAVKHYSSGMYLRLAFAVAAHLEPDILIVDEVLAVGDARFQRKCLNKMEDVGNVGRTVLFVSHNMPAITRLCKRAILLEGGNLVQDGPAHQVVSYYLNSGQRTIAERIWPELSKAPGNEIVRLQSMRVRTENDEVADAVDIRMPVGIEMVYDVLEPDHILLPYYHFYNDEGVLVFEALDQDAVWRRRPRPKGRYKSIAWIPGNFLSEGMLFVHSAVMTPSPEVWHFIDRDSVAFNVIDGFEGDSARGDYAGRMTSVVRPMLKWYTYASPDEREDNEGDSR